MKMLKTAADMIKVFVLFTGFTVLFYYAMIWINSEYENYHRYDKPEGGDPQGRLDGRGRAGRLV